MKKKAPWAPLNGLLQDLPEDVCDRLDDELQLVDLPAGKVLHEAHVAQTTIYFPREGIVSLMYALESGDTSEVAMIGNEGVVGIGLLTGARSVPTRAVVKVGGEALAMRASSRCGSSSAAADSRKSCCATSRRCGRRPR